MPPLALAFTRFGLGPRPGDLHKVSADPREALLTELHGGDVSLIGPDLQTTPEIFTKVIVDKKERVAAGGTNKNPVPHLVAYGQEIDARIARVQAVQIGFIERLVTFWMNHFPVCSLGYTIGLAGSFEREAIRPHLLGNFHAMLDAVTSHPAMLLYLNNAVSTGPDSEVGKRQNKGLNENHARELLELHTVGVDGGYSQADVTSLAAVLTGWTVDRNTDKPSCGTFKFAEARHEPGPATVMGIRYSQDGEEQGRAVLADLAKHPSTAQHLATKLARHFVAETPPPTLVKSLASTFERTGGDLRAVAEALVASEEAWQPPTKIRMPQEFVWSAVRALSLEIDNPIVKRVLVDLGQPLWRPPSPKGFSDGDDWLAPDAMTNRLDVATEFASRSPLDGNPSDLALAVLGPQTSQDTITSIGAAESQVQALALLLMSPEFQRR